MRRHGFGDDITDVSGVRVGQATDLEALTGCTVIRVEAGAVCGVSVGGGAPGTRETDLLRPGGLVTSVHAVVLAGGSAFGLDAACGVAQELETMGYGFDTGVCRVPIVPAAVLFDLAVGLGTVRPDAAMGRAACASASGPVVQGSVGAGTGATVGKVLGMEWAMRGGTGSASVALGSGVRVGGLVCVNCFGDVVDPSTGAIVAGARNPAGGMLDTSNWLLSSSGVSGTQLAGTNTTLAVVATDAALDVAAATRLAAVAGACLAAVIRPCHGLRDGDTLFVLSTGAGEAAFDSLAAGAQAVLHASVMRAVSLATPLDGIPSAATR